MTGIIDKDLAYISWDSYVASLKDAYETLDEYVSESKCPKCGAVMKICYNKKNKVHFLGCTNFPRCTGSLSIPFFLVMDPSESQRLEASQYEDFEMEQDRKIDQEITYDEWFGRE